VSVPDRTTGRIPGDVGRVAPSDSAALVMVPCRIIVAFGRSVVVVIIGPARHGVSSWARGLTVARASRDAPKAASGDDQQRRAVSVP
jgi:hypothetical protein